MALPPFLWEKIAMTVLAVELNKELCTALLSDVILE
jgi:hypothetical protein